MSWVGNSLKLLNGLKGQLVSHSWAQLPRPLNSYSDWLVWWGLASIAKSFSFFLVPQWRTTRFKKQFCSNAHIDCDVSVIYFFGMLYYAHLLSVFLKVLKVAEWVTHCRQNLPVVVNNVTWTQQHWALFPSWLVVWLFRYLVTDQPKLL